MYTIRKVLRTKIVMKYITIRSILYFFETKNNLAQKNILGNKSLGL